MSVHSELDIAIQEKKVLQDAILRECELHGQALFELEQTRGEVERFKSQCAIVCGERERLRYEKGLVVTNRDCLREENAKLRCDKAELLIRLDKLEHITANCSRRPATSSRRATSS